jgi:hypothetical protein
MKWKFKFSHAMGRPFYANGQKENGTSLTWRTNHRAGSSFTARLGFPIALSQKFILIRI